MRAMSVGCSLRCCILRLIFLGEMAMSQLLICVVIAIALLLPTRTLPQEASRSAPPALQAPEAPGIISQLTSSSDLAQDKEFITSLHARDNQLVIIQELTRLLTFHNNFRSSLDQYVSQYVGTIGSKTDRETINAAKADLDNFEKQKIDATSDLKAQIAAS